MSIGNASTSVGPCSLHEARVQLGDRLLVDEHHGQLGRAAHPLRDQHRLGKRTPTGEIDFDVALLVGDEHLGLAVAADPPGPVGPIRWGDHASPLDRS